MGTIIPQINQKPFGSAGTNTPEMGTLFPNELKGYKENMANKKQQENPQGLRIAIDYGSTITLVYSNAADSVIIEYKTIVDMIESVYQHCGAGAQIIAERTLGSYDWVDYNAALSLAKQYGITLWKISQNATKNYRLDYDIEKTDEDDARVIWSIGFLTNYHKEEFNPRLIPEGKDIKTLIRLERSQGYPDLKRWLKNHHLPENAAYCQMLIVAFFMFETGQGKKAYERACGLYGLAPKSIQRASANRDLLKAMMFERGSRQPSRHGTGREVVDMRNRALRKECLKEIRANSRRIRKIVLNEGLVNAEVTQYESVGLF